MNTRIWLSSPHMGGSELKYVNEAFDTNWIAPLGPNVDKFEQSLSEYLNIKEVAALNSGTSALHLALILLGIQRDDEVIVSTFTFSASVNPITYQGAIPVFIDSEASSWNMDPDLLESAIKDRIHNGKLPKAIIVVHLYGMPANMQRVMEISTKYDIPIIEDAAEALGSEYNGKKCGTFGTMGILSFNGNKIITTSGGGALVSNNSEYIKQARFLSTQARDNAPHYEHSQIGYNYRMSNVLAGIGRGQLEVLTDRIKSRRENNFFYRSELAKYNEFSFLTEPSNNYFSNFWLTTFVFNLPLDQAYKKREEIRNKLNELNIESRPLWKPMHKQSVFSEYPKYLNGVSDNLFNGGLCLPSGSNLKKEELIKVINTIKELM